MADQIIEMRIENKDAAFVRMTAKRRIDSDGVWEGETIPQFDEREIKPEDIPPGLVVALDAVTAQILTHMQGLRTPKAP